MSKFTEWLANLGAANPWQSGKHQTRSARYAQFEITSDALEDVSKNKAPPELSAELPGLVKLMYEDPIKVLPKIEAALERFPDECHLLNLLGICLSANDRGEQATEAAERNYRLHPDYLFARLNYAETLLNKGNAEEVPAVFGGDFNLLRMYPSRTVYHFTEMAGFQSVLGRYYAAIGELENAGRCLAFLNRLDPDHQTTLDLTRYLAAALVQKAARTLPAGGAGGLSAGPGVREKRRNRKDRNRRNGRKRR